MYFSRLVHQDVRFHELILVLNPRLKDTVFFFGMVMFELYGMKQFLGLRIPEDLYQNSNHVDEHNSKSLCKSNA